MSNDRLTRTELRSLLRGGGRRIHGACFSLIVTPLPGSALSKFTCAVSTKVARKAVERNRIKRLCREAVRKTLGEVKRPLALAFYAKRETTKASYADVARDIETLISKLT